MKRLILSLLTLCAIASSVIAAPTLSHAQVATRPVVIVPALPPDPLIVVIGGVNKSVSCATSPNSTNSCSAPIAGPYGTFTISNASGKQARVVFDGTGTVKKLVLTDAVITTTHPNTEFRSLSVGARREYSSSVAAASTQYYGLSMSGTFARGATVATSDAIQAIGSGVLQDCDEGCSSPQVIPYASLGYTVSGAGLSRNTISPTGPLQGTGNAVCGDGCSDSVVASVQLEATITLRGGDRLTLPGSLAVNAVDADDAGGDEAAQAAVTGALGQVALPIDILPGIGPDNPVKLGSLLSALIPVAILGTEAVPVTSVDPASARFGPGQAAPVKWQPVVDVNFDRIPDLVLFFRSQQAGLACGDGEATLTVNVETSSGPALFEGIDSVHLLGCN